MTKGFKRSLAARSSLEGSWKSPLWLSDDSPESDVVLSTRVRVMRNLQGFPFPHKASPDQLLEVARRINAVASFIEPKLVPIKFLSFRERDSLVSSRLISPEFLWQEPGRVVYLDEARSISVMVNEEDHLRLQVLLGGWQLDQAEETMKVLLRSFQNLDFCKLERFGWLAASPSNAGFGIRHSAMVHLIGLAHSGKIASVLQAIQGQCLSARGAFGESSRAIGAFVQISDTSNDLSLFSGACEYLKQEERSARQAIDPKTVQTLVENAFQFIQTHSAMTLSDALRTLAYLRLGIHSHQQVTSIQSRKIDEMIARIEMGDMDSKSAAEQRAKMLKKALSL